MTQLQVGESFAKQLVGYHLPLFFFVLFALFPFYWMFVTSIKSTHETYNRDVNPYVPVTCVAAIAEQARSLNFNGSALAENCLYHWRTLLRDTLFIRWLENTLLVAIVSTLISLFAGITSAYALARLRFRGADPFGVVGGLLRGVVFYWGELMSGALLGSVPVALIYSFFVEHYVAGMTGAIKG